MIKQIYTRRRHEIDFVEDSSFGRSKLYFLDSMVIFERERLDIFTLFDETSYKKTKIGYIFNKVASDVYYYYHTMSDTAALIDARIHHDTSYLNGTWHYKRAFWPALSDYLEVQQVKDTTLQENTGDSTYQRTYRVAYTNNTLPGTEGIYALLYLSYAPTPLFFTYDKVFTSKYHQPVTRVDIITNDPNSYDVSSRIQLQRSVLTEDEKKVFAAWNRQAAEHPLP